MSGRIQDTRGTLPAIRQRPGPVRGDGEVPGVNGSTGAVTQLTAGGSTGLTTGLTGGGSAQAAILRQAHWAAVGGLTPGFIHEINNVLCVVANHVQLLMLQSERRDWDILRPLQVMSDNLDRVEKLAHRFAAYARSAQRPPRMLCLNALVDNAIALLEHQRTFLRLQIQKEFAQDLPEIEGDPGPLTDAVVELLSAGARAIPRGGTLTISTQSSPGLVMIGFTGAGQWPHVSDDSVILARHIVEQQGGRLVCDRDHAPFVVGAAADPAQPAIGSVTSIRLALPRRAHLSPQTGQGNGGGWPDERGDITDLLPTHEFTVPSSLLRKSRVIAREQRDRSNLEEG